MHFWIFVIYIQIIYGALNVWGLKLFIDQIKKLFWKRFERSLNLIGIKYIPVALSFPPMVLVE